MRTESLNRLACPAPGCAGPLSTLPSFAAKYDGPGEILEAILVCGRCGADYPVLLGVALLEDDLGTYLGTFWPEIEGCAAELGGTGISAEMRSYIGIPGAGQAGDLRWTVSPYLQAHFDPGSLWDDFDDGWWRDSVEAYRAGGKDPYTVLLTAARDQIGSAGAGLAFDVGTSVGRGAAELALLYPYAVGVDRSFRAILAARRHLLGAPSPLTEYLLETEKGNWEARALPPAKPAGNLDFVVASGGALPAGAGNASCVAALNVLCAVREPVALLDDFARVLEPGGLLLVSSPFWSDPSEAGETPLATGGPEYLRTALAPGFEITREEDGVPWLLRVAKRRWDVYLCHCLTATRR
jgi:SAM-dependent methyltransferase